MSPIQALELVQIAIYTLNVVFIAIPSFGLFNSFRNADAGLIDVEGISKNRSERPKFGSRSRFLAMFLNGVSLQTLLYR